MRHFAIMLAGVATLAPDVAAAADAKKTVPYYASISAGRARMRTGPARTYPASWLYQRADLPVKVIAIFKEWRRVEDPDGTQGWMQANLLSENRTAIVRGPQPLEMREKPETGARLQWRAAPGVVGRLSRCAAGWCRFDVKGQAGFVEIAGLWGVDGGETLP
ncbi:SH3 domain-containing protein [uncultured Sphingomonas sp.]|uniref:SH3 domain-containing protein n=1 Tax=uncultured Sphingomonas sp. TaxID=158754 RepID=UPI0035CBC380